MSNARKPSVVPVRPNRGDVQSGHGQLLEVAARMRRGEIAGVAIVMVHYDGAVSHCYSDGYGARRILGLGGIELLKARIISDLKN